LGHHFSSPEVLFKTCVAKFVDDDDDDDDLGGLGTSYIAYKEYAIFSAGH